MNSQTAARQSRRGTVLVIGFYDQGSDGFAVRAESSAQAESGLQELSRESLLDLLDPGSSLDPAARAHRLGQGLYQKIFSGELANLLRETRAAARARGESLRIVLSFAADSALLELPWELLHDGRDFLGLDYGTPIARSLRSCDEAYSLAAEPPLRVLFTTTASAAVQGVGKVFQPLQMDEEEGALRAAEVDSSGLLRVDVARGSKKRPMTRPRLQHLFQTARRRGAPYHIWHHSGHGARLNYRGREDFFLLLDRGDGEADPIPTEFIRRVIAGPRDLRVALLNLCHGGSEVGLGKRLAEFEIPAVIGMRTGILDPAAAAFAQSFYKDLPTLPLDIAVTSGRLAMLDVNWPLEWAQPILFCRARGPLKLMEPEADSLPNLSSLRRSSRFKMEHIKARKAVQVALTDDGVAERPPAFEIGTIETDDLIQIDGLRSFPAAQDLQTELEALRRHLTALPETRG